VIELQTSWLETQLTGFFSAVRVEILAKAAALAHSFVPRWYWLAAPNGLASARSPFARSRRPARIVHFSAVG
jgi:hypothetical protein